MSRLARRLARFLLLEARFRTIYGLCEARGSASRQAWLAASDDERWYRLREYAGPRRPFRDSVGARTFQELVTALADPRFVSFVEVLTGLRLGAAELRVHGLRARDMLRPHSDRWGARRLTFLLYLTPGWREEFGGRFVLLGPGPRRTEVLPAFNSLVVFDIGADTRHFVTPVTSAAASRLRVSVGGWIGARDGKA